MGTITWYISIDIGRRRYLNSLNLLAIFAIPSTFTCCHRIHRIQWPFRPVLLVFPIHYFTRLKVETSRLASIACVSPQNYTKKENWLQWPGKRAPNNHHSGITLWMASSLIPHSYSLISDALRERKLSLPLPSDWWVKPKKWCMAYKSARTHKILTQFNPLFPSQFPVPALTAAAAAAAADRSHTNTIHLHKFNSSRH